MELFRKTIEKDEAYLRQKSKPVDFEKDDWQGAIQKLAEYCEKSDNALAMASIQLGIPLRIIYLKKTDLNRFEEDYNERKVMINPKIISSQGLTTYWEACVSCLDNTGLVERPYKMKIEYYDTNKEKHIEIIEGFPCTVLSHEIDHLDGILHMDIAKELLIMNKEERKIFREAHPYQIICQDGEYIHP